MKYLITLHDNDFYYTLSAFAAIMEADDDDLSREAEFTVEQVKELWKELGVGLYMRYQNPYQYNGMELGEEEKQKEMEHIRNYFTKLTVIMGAKEIAAFEKERDGFSNSEWFYFEL